MLHQSNILSDNILDFLKQYNIRKEKVYVCGIPIVQIFVLEQNKIYTYNIQTLNMIIDDITINEMKKCDYLFICELNDIMRFGIYYCDKRLMRIKKLNTI